MEEKERYEVISPSLNGYAYIHDFKTDNVLNTYDSCDLLNQQDKRIKELEEENKELEIKLDKCGTELVNAESLVSYLENENQQLKKQLADKEQENERLKEEICKYEITLMGKNSQFKQQLIYSEDKDIAKSCYDKDSVNKILDTILKKYGGEDESK